jgi:hypothetical protein
LTIQVACSERRRRVGSMVSLLLGLALPATFGQAHAAAPASADAESRSAKDEQARSFFEIGAQAYEQGRYAEAIEAFENAYQRVPRPGLLFSMAQAYRRAFIASGDTMQLASAIEHYRAYLDSPGALPRRRDAELALERLVRLSRRAARADLDDDPRGGSRLMVSTATPGAAVQVDGGAVVTALPHVATIPPGTHEVTLSAPGYARQMRRILVPPGAAYALDVDLEALPGSLSLSGIAGSEVWLDGRLVAGLPVSRLAVSAGAHQLVVRRPGRLSFERSVAVAPQKDTSIDVVLDNTLQRDAGFVVLAGAGAGALGAGVLALLAYRQQGIAQDWAQTHRERPLLAREYAAYEAAARHRDGFRTVAITTGVASAALAVAAALLLGLDTPPLPTAPAPAVREREDELQLELGTAPGFDSGGIGLGIRGLL